MNCALALYVPGLYILKQNFKKFIPIKKLNAILLARYVFSAPTPNEGPGRYMCCHPVAMMCAWVESWTPPHWCKTPHHPGEVMA